MSASTFKPVASSSTLSKQVPAEEDDLDIDAFLNSEASALTREKEMRRVLASFKLNPYEVLDIPLSAVYDDPETVMSLVKKLYRSKSLLLHPDKLKHEDGPKAFDMLKKAEADLMDAEKRKQLDEVIKDSRMLLLRELNLKADTPDSHPTLRQLQDPPLADRIKAKSKQLLIDEELRRRRINKTHMIAEGADASRREKAADEAKRKREQDKQWEDTRETRVQGWRSFQKGETKKRKVVHKALG